MKTIRLLPALLLLPIAAAAQTVLGSGTGPGVLGSQGVIPALAANPGGAASAMGFSQFRGSPYRTPTRFDDISRGNFPGTVWRSNGETWVAQSVGYQQAIWQRVENIPLPGDVIGYEVSVATPTAGASGTGYVAGDVGKTLTLQGGVVLTISSVAAGAVTGVTITQADLDGVCSPATTAVPILANSGTTGSGATFSLTVLYPTVYSMIKPSQCYTGNAMTVTNSVTGQTKAIPYLSNYMLDEATALAFGTNGQPMEQYQNVSSGPSPLVTTWNDGGGNPSPNNATASPSVAPVLFRGRRIGNSLAVLFNSQGNNQTGQPYPAVTTLTIPNGVTCNGANCAIVAAGGGLSNDTGSVYLNPTTGASAGLYFGMQNKVTTNCISINAAGTSQISYNASAGLSETPEVTSCSVQNGTLWTDSGAYPNPLYTDNLFFYGTIAAGYTITATTPTSSSCGLSASHSATYTLTASDTMTTLMLNFANVVNADSVFAAAGITASIMPPTLSSTAIGILTVPLNSNCAPTVSVSGSGFGVLNNAVQKSGVGWTYQGGTIGFDPQTSYSGNSYDGFIAIIPWSFSAAKMQMLRTSLHHYFDFDGHPGVALNVMSASNMNGFLTPFLQDVVAEIPKLLGRNDVQIINTSGTGASQINLVSNWSAFTGGAGTLYVPNTGLKSNNICLLPGQYNDLTTTGSSTTLYNAIQTIAGYCHAANWSTICGEEIAKGNLTATQISENAKFFTLLQSNPGACDAQVNPTQLGIYGATAGPWNWPIFVIPGSGSHVSGIGNMLYASMWAEQIRKMIQ